ncbi:MAG: TIGR03087 family PEP-CTERM/XrtA system glycosyltransferase [Halioglobus sp.]|nr:TIGR03087 family PEP-CTERM/XrtA system glycosyltransferase [Halioglobus sp.]
MKKLLYLVHRLPYPPNKGDKICSNNMLNYFSANWRVYLGTFIDDPDDWQYVDHVRAKCEDTCIVNLPRYKRVTGSIAGFLTNGPLSLSFYASRELQRWVRATIERERPDAVLIYSGVMGRFVRGLVPDGVPVVFDAEDVDSEKWRGYAQAKKWPMSWLYRREADLMLAYERAMAASTDFTIFISPDEAALFRTLAPESAAKTHSRTQGVDSTFFDPALAYDNPYEPGQKVLVFTGAMDYWPNIEAVTWFCEQVLETVRAQVPDFLFCIVGMKPTVSVIRLGKLPGVRVTGGVPDVRPYLAHAHAACLPLQLARGIQNKALEAMAMALPVLATEDALLGIIDYPGSMSIIARDADEMARAAVELLSSERQTNAAGRECVMQHYDWDTNLKRMERFLLPEKTETAL